MTFDAPGFLQRTSTLGGDLNLIAQLVLGLTLVVGLVLARRGHYRALLNGRVDGAGLS